METAGIFFSGGSDWGVLCGAPALCSCLELKMGGLTMGHKRFVRFKRSRFDRQMIDTFTYEQIISHGKPAMMTTRGRTPVSVRVTDIYYGRCAYCGKLLTATNWHWMRDEYGQLVKKCNNERSCYNRRSEISEKAFGRR